MRNTIEDKCIYREALNKEMNSTYYGLNVQTENNRSYLL